MFFFLRLSYIFFKTAAPLCFFKPKRKNLTFCLVDKKIIQVISFFLLIIQISCTILYLLNQAKTVILP